MASRLDQVTDWEKEARGASYDPVVVAQAHEVTLRRLEQYCQTYFGECPRALFRRIKLEHARQLVEQGLPIKEVARTFGYLFPTDFIAAFRQQFGCTPRACYRRVVGRRISPSPHFPSPLPHNTSQIPYQLSSPSAASAVSVKPCKKVAP